mgnify:CR=1 FL=1|tara:strand:- start:6684 stop:6932 length:249 start_codon:yes stop_codon:yes gene_type:complete
MIDMVGDILWLATALAVFSSVVLFILNPLYSYWVENKYNIDLESDLYIKIEEAVETARAEGKEVSVQIILGETEIEKAAKET